MAHPNLIEIAKLVFPVCESICFTLYRDDNQWSSINSFRLGDVHIRMATVGLRSDLAVASLVPSHCQDQLSYLSPRPLRNTFQLIFWSRFKHFHWKKCNKHVSQVWVPLATRREPAGDQNRQSKVGEEILNFQIWINHTSFSVWVRYYVWNFKGTILTKYLIHTLKGVIFIQSWNFKSSQI